MNAADAATSTLQAYETALEAVRYAERNLKARAKAIRLDRGRANWAHSGDAHHILSALIAVVATLDNDPDREAELTIERLGDGCTCSMGAVNCARHPNGRRLVAL